MFFNITRLSQLNCNYEVLDNPATFMYLLYETACKECLKACFQVGAGISRAFCDVVQEHEVGTDMYGTLHIAVGPLTLSEFQEACPNGTPTLYQYCERGKPANEIYVDNVTRADGLLSDDYFKIMGDDHNCYDQQAVNQLKTLGAVVGGALLFIIGCCMLYCRKSTKYQPLLSKKNDPLTASSYKTINGGIKQ